MIVQTHQDQTVDAEALHGVLDKPLSEAWTEVTFHGQESMEWMYLWLACTMNNALSRMTVEQSAIEQGTVTPQFGWGAMATTEKDTIAYLTVRQNELASDGSKLHDIGVIGHGPRGDELCGRVVSEIRTWNKDYRSATADFEIHTTDAAPIDPRPGRFIVDTPLHQLVVTWH